MIKYTNSRDINFRSIKYHEKTPTANALKIDAIASKLVKKKDASHNRCQKCKAIITLDGDDLMDLNGKNIFATVLNVLDMKKFV